MAVVNKKASSYAFKIFAYAFCILLTVLSIFPFVIMIVNATRNTAEIQSHAVSFIPGNNFRTNWNILMGRGFNPLDGFKNSLIVSVGSTACNVYFSTMTAYAIHCYNFKAKKFILEKTGLSEKKTVGTRVIIENPKQELVDAIVSKENNAIRHLEIVGISFQGL